MGDHGSIQDLASLCIRCNTLCADETVDQIKSFVAPDLL